MNEVDSTFRKSMNTFEDPDENKEKKALHEIFEEGARVNPKKVTFHIV